MQTSPTVRAAALEYCSPDCALLYTAPPSSAHSGFANLAHRPATVPQPRMCTRPMGLPGYLNNKNAAPLHPYQRYSPCYSKLAEQQLIDSVLTGLPKLQSSKELKGAASRALPLKEPPGHHRAWMRTWHAIRASCTSARMPDVCTPDSRAHRVLKACEENAGKRLLQARQRRLRSAQMHLEQPALSAMTGSAIST
jgi:hypothetical protein